MPRESGIHPEKIVAERQAFEDRMEVMITACSMAFVGAPGIAVATAFAPQTTPNEQIRMRRIHYAESNQRICQTG